MSKDKYIIRSMSKISHKPWELFILSRIIHELQGHDIEFICQQFVRGEGGYRYMTDIYFPQFSLHLEVDEPHHNAKINKDKDAARSRDIIDATGHDIVRISVCDSNSEGRSVELPIASVNKKVDAFIDRLFKEMANQKTEGTFKPWDFENRFSPDVYIKRGTLDVVDEPAFRTHRDALRCFGYRGGHFQQAVWAVPHCPDGSVIWFPRFYENDRWSNSISADGQEIVEEPKSEEEFFRYASSRGYQRQKRRIVFARYKDSLDVLLYRYLGVFMLDETKQDGWKRTFRRSATRVALPMSEGAAWAKAE